MTMYNLEEVVAEGKLEPFIDALIADDQAKKLAHDEFGNDR